MATSRPPRSARPNPAFTIAVMGSLLLVLSLGLILWLFDTPKTINYSDFLDLVAKDKVAKVVFIGSKQLEGEIKKDQLSSPEVQELGIKRGKFQTGVVGGEHTEKLQDSLREHGVKYERRDDPTEWMTPALAIALPILIVIAVVVFFVLPRVRDPMGGFVAQYLRSPARRYERGKSRVTFDDVADMENAKSELREVIEFLREPK